MAGPSQHRSRARRLPPTFRAFGDRNFRILWPASFLAFNSRWMQMTVLAWFVLQLTGSPLLVALVGFFASLPTLSIGILGGLMADALSRRKIIMATQAAGFTASLAMTILLLTGHEAFWHAYPVLIVAGTGWALDMPSRRALLHDLVGRDGVANAVALDTVGMSASRLTGPIVAGLLMAFADFEGAYTLITLNYAAAFALTSRVDVVEGRRGQIELGRIPRDLARGLRFVRGSDVLLATLVVTVLMNFLLFPYQHIVPVIARDVLEVGPALMGLLQASAGFGALIGAVAVASIPIVRRHGRIYIGGSLLSLVALFAFSFSNVYLLSALLLLALGTGSAGFSTMQSTIVMLVARDDIRGTVLGVVSLGIGMGLVGALIVGLVADAVSPSFALGLNGAVGGVGVVLAWLLMPSLRRRLT